VTVRLSAFGTFIDHIYEAHERPQADTLDVCMSAKKKYVL